MFLSRLASKLRWEGARDRFYFSILICFHIDSCPRLVHHRIKKKPFQEIHDFVSLPANLLMD